VVSWFGILWNGGCGVLFCLFFSGVGREEMERGRHTEGDEGGGFGDFGCEFGGEEGDLGLGEFLDVDGHLWGVRYYRLCCVLEVAVLMVG
jgi:hypothetical protein